MVLLAYCGALQFAQIGADQVPFSQTKKWRQKTLDRKFQFVSVFFPPHKGE
jgi:hypothetical protein